MNRHQLFLALILISNMSRRKRLPHIAKKAIKTTSKAPTFVLVAAPLPRFLKRHKACWSQPSRISFIATCIVQTVTYAMPSLMLLVVEVIAWLSRPVCSESTVGNELRSPDIRVVLIWKALQALKLFFKEMRPSQILQHFAQSRSNWWWWSCPASKSETKSSSYKWESTIN